MKTIAAVATVLIAGSAYAQSDNHMIEFDADSVLQGVFSFDKSNTRGGSTDNDTQLKLDLNYAYTLPQMRRLQVGGRLNYWKGTEGGRGEFEDYGADVGAYYNFWSPDSSLDLQNSAYVSAFVGLGWANNLDSGQRDDELLRSTFAIGKRFKLDRWGINHLVYNPEIAFQSENSTTGGALEYSQNVQLRFLQFSLFF